MRSVPSGARKNIRLGRTHDRPYWVVIVSIVVRALHQIGAAVFLAVFLLEDMPALPFFYLLLTSITGVLLLFTEGLRHRQIFRELSGVSTILKVFILGIAYHGFVPEMPAVLFVFFLASFFSHAPKTIRHRLLL